MLRTLVINADDLGLTKGVNAGIFDAHDHGVLTSASLFANAPATADAVFRAGLRPSLGIGCHLALVDGQPTLPARRVPTLITDDGRFHQSWKPFIVACLTGRVSLDEVEQELTAQIDRLRSEGITLTHLDAHKHTHAYPPIFAIVARLARRFGIPAVRIPFERWVPPIAGERDRRRTARRQALENAALWYWARRDARIALQNGLRTPNFAGRVHTGLLSADTIESILRGLPAGLTELMVHPGYFDGELAAVKTRLRESRGVEVELLCDASVRTLLARERIDLVRHDLTLSMTRSLRHVS
ncbi:MAG: ChbG/HpnK family deacetylase [Acidobacteria bacterium]|nr:ChbG/HpnK family deacetylase [Acidobacteriota bacterium]